MSVERVSIADMQFFVILFWAQKTCFLPNCQQRVHSGVKGQSVLQNNNFGSVSDSVLLKET